MTTIPTLFVYFLYDHIPTFFYIFKKCFLLLVCILFSDILNNLCTSLCQYDIHYAQDFLFFVRFFQFRAISSALTLTTQWPLLINFIISLKLRNFKLYKRLISAGLCRDTWSLLKTQLLLVCILLSDFLNDICTSMYMCQYINIQCTM